MCIVNKTAIRISELMKLQNLSVEELAYKSKISTDTIKGLLASKEEFNTSYTIFRICCGLDIELTDFYKSNLFSEIKNS